MFDSAPVTKKMSGAHPLSCKLRILALFIATSPVAFMSAAALHAQTADLPDIPSSALDAYKHGLEAEGKQQLDVALDRFQTSVKLAGKCSDCIAAVARVQQEMGDDKAALTSAAKMIATAPNPTIKARGEMLTGRIFYDQSFGYSVGEGAYQKDPRRALEALKRAEAAMQRAAVDDPNNEPALMLHAHTLAALQRDEDARKEFVACAAVPGTSTTECARALRLSKNIEIARNEPAPSFEATTIDGKKVSLDSLAGKIVLVDFWGSWCPVCVSDAPYVQSMLDSFSTDRFVLLEVDSGDSQDQWTNYVEHEHLKGVQTRDALNQMQSLFRVGVFPTYFVLDGDGVIRLRARGNTGDLRGEVRKLLAEQSDSPKPTAPAGGN
jgi:thiol-disulfide isomerase/thioredoxin